MLKNSREFSFLCSSSFVLYFVTITIFAKLFKILFTYLINIRIEDFETFSQTGCSVSQSCLTVCNYMDCSTPGLSVPHHLPKFAQVHVHCISDAISIPHPLIASSPSILNFSQHQWLFQWVDFPIRWPKYWSFSFSISPFNEYSGLISLKTDWIDFPWDWPKQERESI